MDKYFIKKGDSLESISNELGLTFNEIINYHNSNSQLHDNIKNMELPIWSNYIFISDSIENLLKRKKENESVINFKQKKIDTTKYLITQKIDMQVSGNSMIDSETEIVWSLNKYEDRNQFCARLIQESHNIKYIKSIYRGLAEYMQKFNKPMEDLILDLSETGSIENIANQSDIFNQWMELKKELSPQLGNTLEEKQMLESGDKDFSQSLPLLKKNTLYNLFFNNYYNKYQVSNKFDDGEKQIYISQLFSNEKVNIVTKRKIEKIDDNLKVIFFSEADPTSNNHLKSIYEEKLKPFFQENYNYSFTWSIEYLFNMESGKMLSCNSKIKEQTGSQYSHITSHLIEVMKN